MVDKEFASSAPIGLVRLIQELGIAVPLPAVRSEVTSGPRRSREVGNHIVEQHPRVSAPTSLIGHLKFAMRYEPIDLGVLRAVFSAMDRADLEAWARDENTGVFARRAWHLYEFLMDRTLDVPDVPPTGYADLLDPRIHVTGPVTRFKRQRVNHNLLGVRNYCPLIRKTSGIENFVTSGLDREAQAVVESCDPGILARAVNYLYNKETKSSFAIEGEAPQRDRAERFVAALADAIDFDADPEALVNLQNAIVDSRYAEKKWRTGQNFVGRTRRDFTEHVDYVCPRPEDVPDLMHNWMRTLERLRDSSVHPVCAAAAAAFGFVFIHPFWDGNGRIHRFLIHHVLARAGFTPPNLLLPISAVMLRDRAAYDRVLRQFSSSIMPFIQYTLHPQAGMEVHNETAHLYQYWDATPFAEYLQACIVEAIRQDLREEIGFLSVFDAAVRNTMEIVDMPDRRASLLVRLILQNNGRLSKSKRPEFSELTDEEIARIEAAVRAAQSTPT